MKPKERRGCRGSDGFYNNVSRGNPEYTLPKLVIVSPYLFDFLLLPAAGPPLDIDQRFMKAWTEGLIPHALPSVRAFYASHPWPEWRSHAHYCWRVPIQEFY
jgi:hypothetical protein